MTKARWCTLLTVLLCCSACSAPSLRHKKEVNKHLASNDFIAAQQSIEKSRTKEYSRKDSLLYALDVGAVLHDGGMEADSDKHFAYAQDRIDELFTKSLSAYTARYLINDLTAPYQPAPYERVLTYYYRAMNFLSQGRIGDALVEANRAVYYLDHLRDGKKSGWREDPFVQYFMSLVFESAGKRDDARIARARASQAAPAIVQALRLPVPPADYGEVILVHANGVVPLKKSQTFQVAWGDVFLWLNDPREQANTVSPEIQNAISAGLLGNAITVAYPVVSEQPFEIQSSEVITQQGESYPTSLLGDVAGSMKTDLKEKEAGTLFRLAIRAASKRVAAVQAKHAAARSSQQEYVGDLAAMLVSFLGALTEKADTRQWFTLPAQLRLARFYVPAGTQDITLRFRNGFGKIVGEYTFKDVAVPAGGRVYLHHRTAK
ncbi:MAG: hypothetical protein IKN49_01065 [Elusimicrobiaceae bacterium]|nr:hypothetical protein [Elusimicrobiaceae bacterium]